MVLLIITLLLELTAKQELYLARMICGKCETIGIVSAYNQNQEKIGELLKNSNYYNFKVEIEFVKKSTDLPKSIQNLIDKKMDILWIFDDSINGDPMSLRFLVTKTQESKIPIICQSEKQLQFGATFLFGINKEGKVSVKVKKAAMAALKIELPESGGVQFEIIE